jgi:hypothetical protein
MYEEGNLGLGVLFHSCGLQLTLGKKKWSGFYRAHGGILRNTSVVIVSKKLRRGIRDDFNPNHSGWGHI